jgi:hypothetical protein
MKKLFIAAIAVMSFGLANAQESAIKANPLALLGGSDLLSYEFGIGESSTLVIGGGIGGYKLGGFKYSSFGGEVQYRYYFDEKLKGWYGGARAGFNSGKVKSEGFNFSFDGLDNNTSDSETNFTAFGGGVMGGYQFIIGSGFVIDLNLGASFTSFSYDTNDGVFDTLDGSGIFPRFGFGLGYAF